MKAVYDARSGRFRYPETDAERAEIEEYVDRVLEDPCTCPVVDGPHHHAPYAYPVHDGGAFYWCGG